MLGLFQFFRALKLDLPTGKRIRLRDRGDYYVLGILNVLNFFEIFEIKVLNMLPH